MQETAALTELCLEMSEIRDSFGKDMEKKKVRVTR